LLSATIRKRFRRRRDVVFGMAHNLAGA
jgi:hypothetical protein